MEERAKEILSVLTLDQVAECYMDDDIREEVHCDPKMFGVSDIEWLSEYLKRHFAKYGDLIAQI